MFNCNKIKHLIKQAEREDEKFKKKDFLKAIDLSAPSYNAIEQGTSVPKVTTLWNIAQYFGKDMNYFFDMDEIIISKETKVNITSSDSILLRRVEQLAIENSKLKEELELIKSAESASSKRYPLSNVQDNNVAEPEIELKNPHSQTN